MAMRGIGAFIGLVLVLSALPAPAAEFVVVAGGAPGLMPGQVVQSGATLEIPTGASVTLVSESGKTLTLKGPHSGPAGTGGGGNPGPGLIKALSGLLTVSGQETASLGTMRGVQPPPPPVRGTNVSLQRLWPVTAHRCPCCSSNACTSATSQQRESAGATLRIRWRKLHRIRAASEPVRRRLLARLRHARHERWRSRTTDGWNWSGGK